MLMPPWVVWTTRTLRGQSLVVNLAVGGYAGCVLLWKLGSGENVCTVGRRVERNGLAALGGCHYRIDTVLRGTMVVKALSSQLIESVLCVAVSGMFFALVSTLVSRSEWFFHQLKLAW